MDSTDDAFFREARSQIRTLDDGLLAIERGEETVTVHELFRVAHSLKGSCRTQGLAEAGDLAHSIEDVLDAIRHSEVEPTPTLMDETLAVLDLLEATVRAAATGTQADGDADATRAALRETLEAERSRTASRDADSDADDGSVDRLADRPDSGDEWNPADGDLSDDVVAALEDTTEFDDIDALLDEADGEEADEDLDSWGMLDDGTTNAAEPTGTDGDAPESTGTDDDAETPENPSAFFAERKAELDEDGGIDGLQKDIDAVEFGEFDEDDNYTIDELIDLDPEDGPPEAGDEETGTASVAEEVPADAVSPDELVADELSSDEMVADEASGVSATDSKSSPPDDSGDVDPLADPSEVSPSVDSTEASSAVDPTEVSSTPRTASGDEPAEPDRSEAAGVGADDEQATAETEDVGGKAENAEENVESAEEYVYNIKKKEFKSPVDGEGPTAERAEVEAEDGAAEVDDEVRVEEAIETEPEAAEIDEDEAEAEAVPEDDGSEAFVFGHATGSDADSQDAEPVDDESADAEPVDAEPVDAQPADDETDSTGDESPDPDSISDSEPVPASDSVPDSDSLPEPDSIPDPNSVPEADLGLDLSDDGGDGLSDLGSDLGETPADDPEMDVSVGEEMAEFESRFGDLLGGDPGSGTADAESVFRSAVGTIEDSRLDADEFPTADATGAPDGAGDFDRLQSMTVDVDTADRLLNVAEELSLTHLRLDEAVGPETNDAVREEVANLLGVVTEYRRTVMDVRLMPLDLAVETLPRTVRDVARSQDKDVELVVDDADVELDRSIIDRLRDPLVHVARNAVDHGIEPPDERETAGKPPEGTVEIRAERVGDEVVIEVSDDGRGIDPEALRRRAVEEGVLTEVEAEALTDAETYDLLFEPGFTTTEEVTDVSGRGVGMDVVNRTIADLNGSVTVESDPGEGTTVRLTVPVSIALTEVLFVEANGETFGVPMSVVEQITAVPPVETVEGRDVVRRSDLDLVGGLPEGVEAEDAYPLVRLRSALDLSSDGDDSDEIPPRDDPADSSPREDDPDAESRVVWVRAEDELAIRCDRVVTSQEVVVRPYGDLLRDVPGVSGATTLGDGEAVNVLDVGSI